MGRGYGIPSMKTKLNEADSGSPNSMCKRGKRRKEKSRGLFGEEGGRGRRRKLVDAQKKEGTKKFSAIGGLWGIGK